MIWTFDKSTLLAEANYTFVAEILTLTFKDGTRHTFLNVPAETLKALIRAPSAGRFYMSHIRDQFEQVR